MTWDCLSAEVAVMFADHSRADSFEVQYCTEVLSHLSLIAKREAERDRYRRVKLDIARHEKRKAYKREWISAYAKRKREQDPQWLANRRERNRETMRRLRRAA